MRRVSLKIVGICLGACLGALSRCLIMEIFAYFYIGSSVALLVVNSLGCFLSGFILPFGILEKTVLNFFVFAGFLSSFTTFSAFILQLYLYIIAAQFVNAAAFLGWGVFYGMLLFALGVKIGAVIKVIL
jgi:fluoride exporter